MDGHGSEGEKQGETGRRFGRRGVLLGGLGALFGAAFTKSDDAEAATGTPMILGVPNTATSPTELFEIGTGPAFAARQSSDDVLPPLAGLPPAGLAGLGERFGALGSTLAPSELSISEVPPDLRAGVSGFSDRFGMLGSTLLPRELAISEVAPDFRVGVTGFSNRFGMLGSTLLPGELVISEVGPDLQAGVSGFGRRFGMLGSTLAPRELAISEVSPAGVFGRSTLLGVWGAGGAEIAPSPTLGPAGVAGTAAGEASAITAENPAGTAFKSLGRLVFSAAGRGEIPQRGRSAEVADPSIRSDSLVNVTLLGDPGPRTQLHYVAVADGRLTVSLTAAAVRATPFAYFVFHSL